MKDVIVRVADWHEFSAIQAIRKSVFQEEQGVDPDLDFDGEDETSQQLIASLMGSMWELLGLDIWMEKLRRLKGLLFYQ